MAGDLGEDRGRLRGWRRWLAALVVSGVAFAVVYAAAASLGVTSADLATGIDTVGSCDPNGVTTTWTAAFVAGSGYEIGTVTVHGIDASCIGADFAVTLAAASGTGLAEERDANTVAADFGGSGNARTLSFDFASDHIPAGQVQTLVVVFAHGS